MRRVAGGWSSPKGGLDAGLTGDPPRGFIGSRSPEPLAVVARLADYLD
jgi:hypothetical protein